MPDLLPHAPRVSLADRLGVSQETLEKLARQMKRDADDLAARALFGSAPPLATPAGLAQRVAYAPPEDAVSTLSAESVAETIGRALALRDAPRPAGIAIARDVTDALAQVARRELIPAGQYPGTAASFGYLATLAGLPVATDPRLPPGQVEVYGTPDGWREYQADLAAFLDSPALWRTAALAALVEGGVREEWIPGWTTDQIRRALRTLATFKASPAPTFGWRDLETGP